MSRLYLNRSIIIWDQSLCKYALLYSSSKIDFCCICEKIKYWINEGSEAFTFYNWYCADFYSLLLNMKRGLKVFSLPIFQFLKSSSFSHVQCRSGLFYVFMVFEGKKWAAHTHVGVQTLFVCNYRFIALHNECIIRLVMEFEGNGFNRIEFLH